MAFTISRESPDTGDARALVGEIMRDVAPAYPPEFRHGLTPEQLMSEGVAFFILRVDGERAGCGGIKLNDGYAELKRLYVRPPFRGRGLGKSMVLRLEAYAREHGAGTVRLETGIYQREAIAMYEKMGYRPIPPFGAYEETPMNRFYGKSLSGGGEA